MKKAAVAGALLLGMLALSFWNIRFLDRFTNELTAGVERSRACCREGDLSGAQEILTETRRLWSGAKGYTHIFIRHSEVDAVEDAFCDLLSALESEDGEGAEGTYERLLYHIRCVDEMEHITWAAVF